MTSPANRPDVLVLMADQFAAHALHRDHAEDAHFRTPNLDRLAAASVDFRRAYTSFPLCVPARSSLITGRHPHRLGIDSNARPDGQDGPDQPGHDPASLGHWFSAHGYRCGYAGKWHARAASASPQDGFEVVHPFGDRGLAEAASRWFAEPGGAPRLLVASFDDPHGICEHARRQPMPYGEVHAPDGRSAPPLPANHLVQPFAAEAPHAERARAGTLYGTLDYGPQEWREYRATYAALVERADANLGRVLDAVDLERTVVAFVSDHGDGDAAHGWNQKLSLYEESVRVPYLLHVPGTPPRRDHRPTAAVLGLLPTLCAAAGIPAPEGIDGRDALAPGKEPVVVETLFDTGERPRTSGRALVDGRWKYTVYSWGRHREQLHDLEADPGELRNLAAESAYDGVLARLRGELLAWCLETGDTGFLKRLVLPVGTPPEVHERIFAVPY